MIPLEADPLIFMPTSVQNLEIVSFAVPLPPPPLTQLQISQVP